ILLRACSLRSLALFPAFVLSLRHQVLNCTQRHTLLLSKLLCSPAHKQNMRTLQYLARERNRIFDQFNAGYSSNIERLPLHHSGIQLDLALRSEAGSCSSIVDGIILKRTYCCFNGIECRPSRLQDTPACQSSFLTTCLNGISIL